MLAILLELPFIGDAMINGSQMAFANSLRRKDESKCLEALALVDNLNFVMKNKTSGILFECIHLVAEYGLTAVLKKMIERGFSINAQDGHGQTALFIAQAAGNTAMIEILMKADPKLCTKGNNKGVTPIHLGAQSNDVGSLKQYLATGIDINTLQDSQGQVPLHWAAKHGHREAVDVLMWYGARVTVVDNASIMPRHLSSAAGFHELTAYLQSKELSLFERCAVVVKSLPLEEQSQIPELILEQQQAIVHFQQSREAQITKNEPAIAKQQEILTEELKKLSLNT